MGIFDSFLMPGLQFLFEKSMLVIDFVFHLHIDFYEFVLAHQQYLLEALGIGADIGFILYLIQELIFL